MILTSVVCSSARAQPTKEDPRYEEARAAVRRGLAAAARGDHEKAVEEYRQAHAIVPDANIPYRLEAEALVALGRYDEAIAAYEHYLAVKPDVSDRGRVRARIEELAARRTALAAVTSDPPGAEVFLDGAPKAKCSTPCEIPIPPGDHRFVLRLAGRADAAVTIKAAPGAHVQVFTPLTVTAAGPPGSRDDRRGAAEPVAVDRRKTIGLVTFGVGLAAASAAGLMDLAWVGSRIDTFESARSRNSPEAPSAFDDARVAQHVTLGTLITGAVLLATGAAVFLWPPPKATSQAASR
jgi:tetratricopeptide (TPR) repeat protein